MRSKIFVMVGFVLLLSFQGCNTLKGAKEGFKKDWKAVTSVDGWMKEHMW